MLDYDKDIEPVHLDRLLKAMTSKAPTSGLPSWLNPSSCFTDQGEAAEAIEMSENPGPASHIARPLPTIAAGAHQPKPLILNELPSLTDWGTLKEYKPLSANEQVDEANTFVPAAEVVSLGITFPPPKSTQSEVMNIVRPLTSTLLGTFESRPFEHNLYSNVVTFPDFVLRSGHRVVSGTLTVPLPAPAPEGHQCSGKLVDRTDETLTLALHIDPTKTNRADVTRVTDPSNVSRVKRIERNVRIPRYRSYIKSLLGRQRLRQVTGDWELEDAGCDGETRARLWKTRRVTMQIDFSRRVMGTAPSGAEDIWMTCKALKPADEDDLADWDMTALVQGLLPTADS